MEGLLGIWMTHWSAVRIILALVIIGATLSVSRRNYWIAIITFSILALGESFNTVITRFLVTNLESLAVAFLGSPVVFIGLIIHIGWFIYSAVALYPFSNFRISIWIISAIAASTVLYSIVIFGMALARSPFSQGSLPQYLGVYAIYHWLLWLRVHEARKNIGLQQSHAKKS